jgi:uncharacterized membrane protein
MLSILFIAIGGIIMILIGITDFLSQAIGSNFLASIIQLPNELLFVWNIVSILCGIAVLLIIVQQKAHEEEALVWVIVSLLLGILGGTLGGLIVFGGTLIYLLLFIL